MKNIYGVLGAGSWGTAIVKILTEKNSSINWYVRNESNLNHIQTFRKNPNYLSSLELEIKSI
mgnify:FL=1